MDNNRVRVLFLAEELRMGGAETYFYRLESMIDRTLVDFFSMAVPSGNESMLANPELYSVYGFSILDRVKSIVRFLREHPVDVVHANSLRLCFAAIIAKNVSHSNFHLVYTKHNLTKLESFGSKPLVWLLNHYVDAVIAICETDERLLIDEGVRRELVYRINNGVDLERFEFRQRFPLDPDHIIQIGILARLSPEKRHDIFLEIAKSFHSHHAKSKFMIGGDGPEFNRIAEAIRKYKMTGFVSMLGQVEPSVFLNDIDVLLLVSDREVMPMSILEGMASGCAVIARAVGGVGDVVREETGVLVNGHQVDEFVKALEQVFEDQSFLSETISARALVERDFSQETALEQHVDLYRSIADCGDEQ